MTRRRKQLVAAAVALVLVVALVAVLAGGGSSGSSHSISVPGAQIPAGSTDPHAQDRTEITALALAYQQVLGQDAPSSNPCNYLDPQSRAFAMTKARHAYAGGPEPCAFAANQLSAYAGGLSPSGIDPSTIQFGLPSQQLRCDPYAAPVSLPASQRGLSWAIAGWAGANGNQVAVVKENNRWWIDLLLCHA